MVVAVSALTFISVTVQRTHSIIDDTTSKQPPMPPDVLSSTVMSDNLTVLAPVPVVVSTPPLALAVWPVKLLGGR